MLVRPRKIVPAPWVLCLRHSILPMSANGDHVAAATSLTGSALQAPPQQAALPPPPPHPAAPAAEPAAADTTAQPEKTVAEPVGTCPQPGSAAAGQASSGAEHGSVAAATASPDARPVAEPPRPADVPPARLNRATPEVTPTKETARSFQSDATPQFVPRSGGAVSSARAAAAATSSSDSARLKCRVTGEPFSLQEDQQPVELPCCGTLVSVAGAKKVRPPACWSATTPPPREVCPCVRLRGSACGSATADGHGALLHILTPLRCSPSHRAVQVLQAAQ